MAVEWEGIVKATAPTYLKGAQDLTIRGRLHLALLRKYDRIVYNESGTVRYWDVHMAEQPVESYGDAGLINFEPHDLLMQLNLDWRGYYASDKLTEKQKEMNKGTEAIVRYYDRKIPTLIQSITNKFGGELLVDGNATGNSNRLHGINSFMGVGTIGAADLVHQPDDSYGGQNTDLADQGGTWTTTSGFTAPNATVGNDWPDGNGSAEYDYLAPKLVNWSSTSWGTGATDWESNSLRVLDRTNLWMTRLAGKEGRPTVFLLASNMFAGFRNACQAKSRILIPHKEAEDLGFPEVMNYDGVMIQPDFDVPANTAYGLNINQMDLASLKPELFFTKGPEEDIKTLSHLFLVGFFGNMTFQPKFFSKIFNWA